jgi:hypothetical protein
VESREARLAGRRNRGGLKFTGSESGNIVPGVFTPVLAKHKKPFSLIDRVSVGDSIRREVEDSRRRLSVDAIDLYQVHWPPDPDFAELRSVSVNLLFSPTG